MARPEDITQGVRVGGATAESVVEVHAAQWSAILAIETEAEALPDGVLKVGPR